MKWMIAAGLACILHISAYHSIQHEFSIDIPSEWKVTEHESKRSKRFEKALSAHSKKTCTVFFDRFYEQSVSIVMTKHRAEMHHEDLEDTAVQKETLFSLEKSIKSQVKSQIIAVNPIKSKNSFQKNGNYYFALEYIHEDDIFHKQYGLYYQIYTPSTIFGVTFSSPKEDIFKQHTDLFQKIALSIKVKGE